MKSGEYFEVVSLIERLHRHSHEIVKLELDRAGIHDINNVQALMLFNIGDAEMTLGQLMLRGAYLPTNVSYNVKKMVQNGYLVVERSIHDLRSIRVKLTDKGHVLRQGLSAMHTRHIDALAQHGITEADLQRTIAVSQGLERFWIEARNYYRG
jgi:DNA-binding MarR family transcriptional regulator